MEKKGENKQTLFTMLQSVSLVIYTYHFIRFAHIFAVFIPCSQMTQLYYIFRVHVYERNNQYLIYCKCINSVRT